MPWHTLLQPDLLVSGSIFDLTADVLQPYNLKGLILDVDETLLPAHSNETYPALRNWLQALKPHYKIWLVTNNLNIPRIRRIAEDLDLPYLLGAAKPSRRKLRQAAIAMDLPLEQVAMIGDRLFTDVLAGNRLGVFTILVNPVSATGELGQLSWFHHLESWLSKRLITGVRQPVTPKSPNADTRHS